MKLIDKIKDLFMDEVVEDDEDVELNVATEEKKKPVEIEKVELPKVMRETIKREERSKQKAKTEEISDNDEKVETPAKKFNFPIDFESELSQPRNTDSAKVNIDDFFDSNIKLPNKNEVKPSNVNVLKVEKDAQRKVAELYSKKEEPTIKPKFKASPVISPVYGVLDKNYKKDEVKERNEEMVEMKRPSKKVDFETVRKKAFGNLADDIKDNLMCENCELYKEVKKISALKEDDLLYDMTVDDNKNVTIEKAYDNYEEFGVAYEPKVEKKNLEAEKGNVDIVGVINDNPDADVAKIGKSIDEEIIQENDNSLPSIEDIYSADDSNDIPSRKEIKKDKKEDTIVDADFFELIDSMYKERVDE